MLFDPSPGAGNDVPLPTHLLPRLLDQLNRYPVRRLVVSARDYELAKGETVNTENVPLLDPPLSEAVVGWWEAVSAAVVRSAGTGVDVLFIKFYPDGRVQPFFQLNPHGAHPASRSGGALACPNS